jgi:tetratricopeptide (TPR) repeat protein
MSAKRVLVLLGMLAAVAAATEYQSGFARNWLHEYEQSKPLAGKPEVTGLKAAQLPNGHWRVEFDYFHPGPAHKGHYRIEQLVAGESAAEPPQYQLVNAGPAVRGRDHVSIELSHPTPEDKRFTREVKVTVFESPPLVAVASQSIPLAIEWPTFELMRINETLAHSTPEKVVAEQALRIDSENEWQIRDAGKVLEAVVKKYPQTDSAYLELARIAMKSNWGPEGLAQAESLLEAAKQIRPDNPNMKVLLGYVYTHQKRFKEAGPLFAEVAQSPTPNLWLWTNWGELLEMQDKPAAAVEKYKQATAQPPKDDTYDRARRYAFERLIAIADQRHDIAAGEALHKQRTDDYGLTNCYGPAYARFLLYQKVDVPAALAVGEKIAQVRCPLGDVKEILGVAGYMKWAEAREPERGELLRQARVNFPAGPKLFYRLASNDKMMDVARQLAAAGDKIDQVDNYNLTALAYALQEHQGAVARRLVRLGARTDAPVGPEQMPVALIPVVSRDFESIKLMQGLGVDYSRLRYHGFTAFDHARQTQDRELLDALEPKGRGALKAA